MKFGLKLFLSYAAILGLGIYFFLNSMLLEIKPGLRQSLETALIDSANLLAEVVAPNDTDTPIRVELIGPAIEKTLQRPLNATIWNHAKTQANLRVYITNEQGIVIYDSSKLAVGEDYSQWNDVYLTLRGKYGARSTQENPKDRFSSVMYIGAPIYTTTQQGDRKIAGALSVGKPNVSVEPFWQAARDNIRSKGMWLLIAAAFAGALLATWLSLNIHRLVAYARSLSQGEKLSPPNISDPDLTQLAQAMDEMRRALDGKEYVEEYTLNLTHEMKSPLTALQGAAELINLTEDPQSKIRLAQNISQQTERLRALVDEVLALARLENRSELEMQKPVDLGEIIHHECHQLALRFEEQHITPKLGIDNNLRIKGDPLLLSQAIRNLLENALDFSPKHSEITLSAFSEGNHTVLTIEDQGPGIPDYATEQIWQRFYSLPRPSSGQKSTGLGLCFVKQIADLHSAEIQLHNSKEGGTLARFTFHTQNT
ncbi:two-component system sensor histidine kinase CreC [Neptuniibacter caesariensis]|uniref:histidine kinase n=1 Tax=Neptuniibacter caesariensis TaxID=207954 RepID=A0A7U8C2K8_NEPCE|nr:two-component system sensor histidine kinase CreC [Neptuniibacter caesariensis]EAR60332.1 two-component sensor CreC [Neptuniibacter caesariensis]